MPGFLHVYGYYDPTMKKWNIDVCNKAIESINAADNNLQPTVQQLISSLMTIGTFVSSLLVGPFSSRFGRKTGLWTASLLNVVATAVMLGTTSVGALYAARLILGPFFSEPR